MTLLEVAFVLVGLFTCIAAVAYSAEGGPAWMIAAVLIGSIAVVIPWRLR